MQRGYTGPWRRGGGTVAYNAAGVVRVYVHVGWTLFANGSSPGFISMWQLPNSQDVAHGGISIGRGSGALRALDDT